MKHFVQFNKLSKLGTLVIDFFNPVFQDVDIENIIDTILPTNVLFDKIIIKNFYSLPAILLSRLTLQYLHGATITVELKKSNFSKTYSCHKVTPMYAYSFKPLDWNKLPKSIANYDLGGITILERLANHKERYIPNDVWNAIDKIAQERIDAMKQHNFKDYHLAEAWYKELFKDYHAIGKKVFSPNAKTFYEAMADIEFDKQIRSVQIPAEEKVSDYALTLLSYYGAAYGVDVPQFTYCVTGRKTAHGWTNEIQRVCTPMTDSEISTAVYDYRNAHNNLPGFVRKGLWHKSMPCPKYIKEAYERLSFLMQYGEEFLMPGWHICPECGDVYHEERGCDCGAVDAIEFVSADNLFYANAGTYEDLDICKKITGIDD